MPAGYTHYCFGKDVYKHLDDQNIKDLLLRNENCFLDIKGQINTRLRGKYYNNRYLFNNCYFKLKIKKICKIKELDDLSIFKINIKGIAYFKNINSKIELNSDNSLIIARYYD